ncbi:MAG: S8 family serine peptidase [Thermoanaerobaculales bacterium]|jgi:hypothetical protein|nr:S8 family serine peptidase [Thermoanaerobaculales bacterium]
MKKQLIVPTLAVLIAVAVAVHAAPGPTADRLESSVRMVSDAAEPLDTARVKGFVVRDGRVQVVAVVVGGAAPAVESWLWTNGARWVVSARDRVQAFVAPSSLEDLAGLPGVLWVERPVYAELPEPAKKAAPLKLGTLAVVSEGVEATNAAAWNAEGYTGSGVRVGVIDVQFGGWEDLLGVELPPAPGTSYRAFGGASLVADEVHGTACAEIIHDLAPDAELYLAHIRTLNDFYSALDWFAGESVDVVTMSLGWYGTGPGDGTGQISDEITTWVTANDALFITSAGNERRAHWQGASADDNGDDWVDFAPGVDLNRLSYTIDEGERVSVNMVWNDWNSPTSDYSLHLYRLDDGEPVEVAVSDRPQTGQSYQTPTEQVSHTADDGGRFAVRIGRAGVTGSHDMEIFSLDSDIDSSVPEGSLTAPADVAEVIAVAAVSYSSPFSVRSFSSAGPTNGPGGSLDGGSIKPDLSGYDGVSTVSYGTRDFYGTSAAAPHVAGAAAVALSSDPGMGREELRLFLEDRSLNLGPAGKDNDFGWGRVFLGQSPGSTCTFDISPTQADVAARGGGGVIRLTTQDGCPWSIESSVEWISAAPASGTGGKTIGFSVDENTGPPRTGELVVAGLTFTVNQAGELPTVTTMVAGIAETEGLAQTRWKSDLAILNPGAVPAEVEMTYRFDGGLQTATATVGPGELVEFANVAADTFGAPDSAGAVELESSAELVVTARTFNDTPDGTFGQFIPGVTGEASLSPGDVGVLSQLGSNDDVRTNIGFVDLDGEGALARIRLFDGNGDSLGSDLGEVVTAGAWTQVNRVFRKANAGDCSGCYALVDLVGETGSVWAYASVVDASSGDPTTIPMELLSEGSPSPGSVLMVAGIAETAGANDTSWKSNLALLNLAGRGVTADLVYRYGTESASTSVTLTDGELVEYADIAAAIFGAPGSSGAVEVAADGELVVTARTFNDAPSGTFGQFLPGLDAAAALASGDAGFLSQLKSTDGFRTNIGFTNYGEAECTARVRLYDDEGAELKITYPTVPPGGWLQQNRVFERAGVAPVPLGYAVVEVLTPDCEVWTYASVVDNTSGDPTTVPVVRAE